MRTTDVSEFNSLAFEASVEKMAERREAVHKPAEEIYRRTGRLDPLVDVYGTRRLSRTAMAPHGDGLALAMHGIPLSILNGRDATGSMAENVDKAFYASGLFSNMLSGVGDRYQPQIANGIYQDVGDTHPVCQVTQFEPDERQAEQQRMLYPDRSGGDTPEDVETILAYAALAVELDMWRYGLKGHFQLVGDQVGRGFITPSLAEKHLGHKLQAEISTSDLIDELLGYWHLFFIQVGSGGGGSRNSVTTWWEQQFGSKGHVVICPDPDRLAFVQAGLIYVLETASPTEAGLKAFLSANGDNTVLSDREAREVWSWLQIASPHFGAQTKLPGYADMPLPGSIFAHYRHTWPIDHPKADENVTPAEGEDLPPVVVKRKPRRKSDMWKNF